VELHRTAARLLPQLGVLVEMMANTRMTTTHAVKGMTPAALNAIPEGFSNSVGMRLAHIAATDRIYQGASFENRDLFDTPEYAPDRGAMTLGVEGDRTQGRMQEDLLTELEVVRAQTLAQLAKRDDTWPASPLTAPGFEAMNQHWAWFHVMEEEVSNRSQIRILRGALQPSGSSG
jgi:Protein of unknown function (DUF664)